MSDNVQQAMVRSEAKPTVVFAHALDGAASGASDRLEAAVPLPSGAEEPDPCPSPGGRHSPAYCPRHGQDECWRCHAKVRYVAADSEERPATPTWVSTTGRHEWPVFDEADIAPPNGTPAPSPATERADPAPTPIGADGTPHVEPVGPARPFPGEGVGFDPEPAFPAPAPDVFDFGAGHDDADGASR